MMDDLMRDLQVLWKADSLIGRIWLNVLARRLALSVFAALIAVFGLGMANVAGFYGLQPSYGFVWSAAIVAVVDFVLAALVLWLASRAQPGTRARACARSPQDGDRVAAIGHSRRQGRGRTRSARTSSKPGTALRASSKIH